MNLDNETGRKAGDSSEEPAEKVVGKTKVAKASPKWKVLKQKRKSSKKRQSTSSSSDSGEIERKRRRKKRSGQKRKRKSPSSSKMFQVVTPQQAQIQRLQLLIQGSR